MTITIPDFVLGLLVGGIGALVFILAMAWFLGRDENHEA